MHTIIWNSDPRTPHIWSIHYRGTRVTIDLYRGLYTGKATGYDFSVQMFGDKFAEVEQRLIKFVDEFGSNE